ncbi:citrate synthase [Ochrobactrum daejeonense]|uniref:Citrate synthase n=2 Tax=Brucella daejeonensis TaxID=659015 RepID=A0A7W9EL20_9HYPH|nr:citrate synthase [Brucella daejeonensis]
MRSAISTVTDGRLLYRGYDASDLSPTATLEDVVALLWQAEPNERDLEIMDNREAVDGHPLERLFKVFGIRAANDLPSMGRSPSILKREAWDILQLFHDTVLGAQTVRGLLHEHIAQTWDRPDAADTIRRALVLLADHELNASAFAARVTASTGAPLSAAVLSGLSALIGPLHGRAATATAAIVERARLVGAEEAIRLNLLHGTPLQSFGHLLYRETGDIRASLLLADLELPSQYLELQHHAAEILGEKPNVDFALSAIAEIYDLPPNAPLYLFALARIVGWLAHALEQAESGSLIRPRAEFIPPIE